MVTAESMARWCRTLLGADKRAPQRSLEEYLDGIPRLDSLADLSSGTVVLVRGDVDAKPGPTLGDGDVRLRSMLETLQFGRRRGWKQIIFGHVGRKPEGSLQAVAKRLGELLDSQVPLVGDWLDEPSLAVRPAVAATIAGSPPASVLVLENTRRYAVERLLWEAGPEDVPRLAGSLARLANELAEKVARVYLNEALSAGSLDSSTTIVPAAMERVALGSYVAREFDGPMRRCLRAQLVVFSGLKTDKLDDLEAMIARGTVRRVFAAGSLAMALKKADAELAGKDFCLGVAEDPARRDQPYYIARERVEQAKRMLERGRGSGIQFVLPVDFVLQDGRAAEKIGPADQQFDVGPQSSALFAEEIGRFIAGQRRPASDDAPAVAFHNGVFGMFEDPRFEQGTRRFMAQLKRMTEAGIEVYVGGGEGGTALELFGRPDWVTHCFTAGGTVLAALGNNPVPYLQALWMAAEARRTR